MYFFRSIGSNYKHSQMFVGKVSYPRGIRKVLHSGRLQPYLQIRLPSEDEKFFASADTLAYLRIK